MMDTTEEEKIQESNPNVLVDTSLNILKEGLFRGSIITKMRDKSNSIIFSDKIEIIKEGSTGKIITQGLRLRVIDGYAESIPITFSNQPIDQIHYSVKLPDDIVEEFDKARFNTNFPSMIEMLNTHLLYNYNREHPRNHLEFVKGEIVNHPISLLYNDSIIVSDRIVVDDVGYPIFYDAFIIKRNSTSDTDEVSFTEEEISFSYEPIFRINIHFIKYIIILGVEMLK
jgi:hypothetical protein